MPAPTTRTIDSVLVATEAIPSENFIPHFLQDSSVDLVRDRGNVGVRGFGWLEYAKFSPFVMMSDITIAPPLVFPDHPHFGHEFVMYVLDGEFTHEDFMGWKCTFKPGDLHWLTTGKGLLHAQVPGAGPKNRHVQFWINLPREKKNSPPENQTLESKLAPVINQEGSEVRLLAGKYASRESPIKTMSPLILLDVQLAPNSTLNLSLPGAFFIGTYVVDGSGIIGNQEITSSSITLSNPTSSDETILCCSSQVSGLRFLLYGGEPLKEPIDVDGFFVCSTTEETKQTVKDFHDRKNGFQAGSNWKSNILGNLN